ncbi:MAG: hypothetical protein H7070_09710 [Saprospiraceae bacterium]|nr:hypothetical protein [Pyrinomonadaceae bacterium]
MLAFIYSFILFASETGKAGGGFTDFYNTYLNYPGFEFWKFLNLAIFTAFLVYVGKKPLTEAFKAKREAIRAELIKAEEEKQAALEQLTIAEAKLSGLEPEKKSILEHARAEADAETVRLGEQAELEVGKMTEQASGEISRLNQVTKAQLRKFSAEESVRLAEEKLRSQINVEKDAALVKSGIQAIGGLN